MKIAWHREDSLARQSSWSFVEHGCERYVSVCNKCALCTRAYYRLLSHKISSWLIFRRDLIEVIRIYSGIHEAHKMCKFRDCKRITKTRLACRSRWYIQFDASSTKWATRLKQHCFHIWCSLLFIYSWDESTQWKLKLSGALHSIQVFNRN